MSIGLPQLKNIQALSLHSLLAALANSLFFFTLSWLTYEQTRSALSVGLLIAVSSIPKILFSSFVGVLVDRYERKKLLLILQSLRVLMGIVLIIASFIPVSQLLLFCVITFLWAFLDRIYMPTFNSLKKECVAKDNYLLINTKTTSYFQFGMLSGSLLGGWLNHVATPVLVGSLYGILSVLALIPIVKVHKLHDFVQKATGTKESLLEGIRAIFLNPLVTIFMMFLVLNEIILQCANILVLPIVKTGLGYDSTVVGYITTGFGAGGFIGSLILMKLISKMPKYLYNAICFAVCGSLFYFLGTTSSVLIAGVCFLFLGMVLIQSRIIISTGIMETVGHQVQGRVNSNIQFISSVMGLSIYLILGHLVDSYGTYVVLSWSAGIILLLTVGIEYNRLRTQPKKVEEIA